MPRSILYSKLLASTLLCLISLSVNALEKGITLGISDYIVTDINPNPIYDGTTSHSLGISAGAFFKHTFVEDITVGGSADVFLEHDNDHLDSDHIPLMHKIQLYSFGPIHKTDKDLRWLVDIRDKENTVSGIEREIKTFFGVGINSDSEKSHIAFNIYAGFFFLEFDDDAPKEYAGYGRIDLDDGAPAASTMIEGSIKLSDRFTFSGSATNWSVIEGDAEWLENEFMAEVNYASSDWIKHSIVHFSVLHTHYNLAIHYRENLGKPILPWDKDVLVRLYVSLPWGSN